MPYAKQPMDVLLISLNIRENTRRRRQGLPALQDHERAELERQWIERYELRPQSERLPCTPNQWSFYKSLANVGTPNGKARRLAIERGEPINT